MLALRGLSVGLLMLGLACHWAGLPQREKIFAAHETGLTLIYENPQLESPVRMDERLQVRVASVKEGESGTAARVTFTTLKGEFSALFLLKKGGLFLSQDERTPGIQLRPEGFPDRVTQWEAHGTRFRVLGRAAADLHGLRLPDGMDRVGVWLESATPQGQRQRVFLLPDIGEVETLVWRDGAWICVNRLVSRGFTDAPSVRE